MTPTVSVIVPNYNHAAFLKQRIDSILAQSYTDFELILLDDCSADDSCDVMMEYKDNPHVSAIIVNEKNTGSPFKQWVRGINEARGRYIWIAESDDYAHPDFLLTTTAQLDMCPEANVCVTGSWVVDENNNPVDEKYRHVDQWQVDGKAHRYDSENYLIEYMSLRNTIYNASMVLFRKQTCLENVDLGFLDMKYAGDWLFWIEQIRKSKVVIEVHSKLNYWWKHSFNTTLEGLDKFTSMPEVTYIKDYLLKTILRTRTFETFIVKSDLYRMVKHTKNITYEKRKEMFEQLKGECGVTRFHYVIGRWFLIFRKHVLHRFLVR